MKQRDLMALLKEAANPETTSERRTEIQCLLGAATSAMGADGTYLINGPEDGLLLLLDCLFVSTIQNRPELLPSLFPAFAIICGNHKDSLVADIDWSLMS